MGKRSAGTESIRRTVKNYRGIKRWVSSSERKLETSHKTKSETDTPKATALLLLPASALLCSSLLFSPALPSSSPALLPAHPLVLHSISGLFVSSARRRSRVSGRDKQSDFYFRLIRFFVRRSAIHTARYRKRFELSVEPSLNTFRHKLKAVSLL
jgi:hypothetical protein